MPLLDAIALRKHIETDALDDVLVALEADAEADVVRLCGPNTGGSDTVILDGDTVALHLGGRVASSITEVKESFDGLASEVTLAADDYELMHGGRTLRRLPGGTNGRMTWAPTVRVTFATEDTDDRRKRVIVDLVKLALTYDGAVKSRSDGDTSTSSAADYERERERILQSLRPAFGFAA